ncbi:neurofilament medium polypeptide isoform X3 [Nilaparvata lugens]|uniref:neurofilament medium polypeptide isoform X1 n=1 Tax=Nilaparvata lugens TaxID=108931 RepID=UPI00193DD961|nr:neurofilament medium polypeptide isoform X1 [Nilaparvata lugens]XP_039298848.1 neurofilament medium polypeptide isoform X2 [Nilaparvata lugens]XP_039298854.1 neurofilament medium polypeptide isoform X2 [Nilaparvata lugens]XP_039298861.1 neurofilament medium polypeptide isoform X3 [Nilaparvata lugens]
MAEEEAENEQQDQRHNDDSFDYGAYGAGLGDYDEGGGDKGGKRVVICLEEDSSKFKPELYTFRRTDPKGVARGPPFWVLTDHLIAVIWNLFKVPAAEEPIGISQLQWALEFLRSIRDDTGEYPSYVQISISQLEDRLLELYASVPFFTEEAVEEEQAPREKEEEAIDEGGGEEGEEEGEEEGGAEESGEPKKKKKRVKSSEEGGEEGEEEEDEEEAEEEEVARQTFGSLVEIDRPSMMTKRISDKVKVPELHKDLIASVTLKDIMAKAPKKPMGKDELHEFLTNKKSALSIKSGGTSSQTKVSTVSPPGASQGEMLKFLNSLRKEQTDRINIELKQLDKIDEFMKDVQTGNCAMGESAIKALYDR